MKQRDFLRKFRDYQKKAEIYYVYHVIQRYTVSAHHYVMYIALFSNTLSVLIIILCISCYSTMHCEYSSLYYAYRIIQRYMVSTLHYIMFITVFSDTL